MKRMTRHIDKYPCRIGEPCPAEEWIEELTGVTNYNWASGGSACDMCPFEKYINRLAEYEDEEELMEDDRK